MPTAGPYINHTAEGPHFTGITLGDQASFTVEDGDLTASAGTETLTDQLAELHSTLRALITHVIVDVGEAFAGGSASAVTIDVGPNGGTITDYVSGLDVFTGATTPVVTAVDKILTATTGIDIRVNCTGDTVDNLTSGDVTVTVLYRLLEA